MGIPFLQMAQIGAYVVASSCRDAGAFRSC